MMVKLAGSAKQVIWANSILDRIKKYSNREVDCIKSNVIIKFGKSVTYRNVNIVVDIINGYNYAKNNGFIGKKQNAKNDKKYDNLADLVIKKKLSKYVYEKIVNNEYDKL